MKFVKPKQSINPTHKRNQFYASYAWQKLSKLFKTENPLCSNCHKHGVTSLAVVCDHIIAISVGGAKLLKVNLQSLCRLCDNTKRRMEGSGDWIINFPGQNNNPKAHVEAVYSECRELIPRGEVQKFKTFAL